ncbi:MAG: hypothetical protein ABIT10_13635 [Alteraurantiacibacter sp.]
MRSALGLALLPFLSSRMARAATAEAVSGTIAPPSGDMIYRRTLQRQLPGGIQLATTRDFRVRFSTAGDGYLVDGVQVSARVEAPANLASLARLEEQRVEKGVFPLALDHQGRIVDGPDPAMTEQVSLALAEVRQRFADGGEVRELLDALSASSTQLTAYLPQDLFAPAEGAVEQRQTIELPWGQTGEVRVRFAASRDADTRLMRLATREVITTLEGEERRSSERWELFRV